MRDLRDLGRRRGSEEDGSGGGVKVEDGSGDGGEAFRRKRSVLGGADFPAPSFNCVGSGTDITCYVVNPPDAFPNSLASADGPGPNLIPIAIILPVLFIVFGLVITIATECIRRRQGSIARTTPGPPLGHGRLQTGVARPGPLSARPRTEALTDGLLQLLPQQVFRREAGGLQIPEEAMRLPTSSQSGPRQSDPSHARSLEQCAVCIAEYEDGELVKWLPDCWHSFHGPCVDSWLQNHSSCPLCRAEVGPALRRLAAAAPSQEEEEEEEEDSVRGAFQVSLTPNSLAPLEGRVQHHS